ncbi:ubiquitin-related domain-containing protein [Kockovaella imperatae]|uniref:Ubiquitin-related domain-containing protein n=1 Tax=Kockovaella imperatae TaxID=4999 RepID=A0A1Y1UED7_9TREE|nr:ubiquitin-related domain-containing protein [Kockovaella imperatae]ORX36421.1 ubiquitin-related domain-containing protein [Kockovaella imperatae]
MDTPLTNDRLVEERAFMKRYSEGLSSYKVEYPGDFSAPLEERPRKVNVIGVPVADPPDVMDVDTSPSQDSSMNLTIKSLKPALTVSVTAQSTDTVADLKKNISKSSSAAPPPEGQRLLLKGKALTDSKLLKEYDIEDGAVVHLMMKPTAVTVEKTEAIPAPSSSHARTPSLTITTAVDDDSKPGQAVPITDNDIDVPPLGPQPQVSSALFHKTLSDPHFWQKLHALCVTEFTMEDDADAAWEVFLLSMKSRLSAGEAAKIRDIVGIRGMGGGAL